MSSIDTYPVNEIRLFLIEAEKKIRVRNCVQGCETDYNLLNNEIGLKITDGTLSIGSGVTLNNPVGLSPGIKLYKDQTQGFFSHLIDPNADDMILLDEACDVEFVGVGDDRDECELVSIGKPRHMYRFRLSRTAIRVQIAPGACGDVLEIRYECNEPDGIDYLVTTNLQYIN